jgi:hypothetical protein
VIFFLKKLDFCQFPLYQEIPHQAAKSSIIKQGLKTSAWLLFENVFYGILV